VNLDPHDTFYKISITNTKASEVVLTPIQRHHPWAPNPQCTALYFDLEPRSGVDCTSPYNFISSLVCFPQEVSATSVNRLCVSLKIGIRSNTQTTQKPRCLLHQIDLRCTFPLGLRMLIFFLLVSLIQPFPLQRSCRIHLFIYVFIIYLTLWRLKYRDSVRTSQRTKCASVGKIDWFMSYREIVGPLVGIIRNT